MAFSTNRQALPDSSLNQQASQSTAIAIQHVTKRFSTPAGQPYTALRDLTLDVRPGDTKTGVKMRRRLPKERI